MPPGWLKFIIQFLAGFGPMVLGLVVMMYAREKWLSTDERKQYIPGGAEVPVVKSKFHHLVAFILFFFVTIGGATLLFYLIDTYWFDL